MISHRCQLLLHAEGIEADLRREDVIVPASILFEAQIDMRLDMDAVIHQAAHGLEIFKWRRTLIVLIRVLRLPLLDLIFGNDCFEHTVIGFLRAAFSLEKQRMASFFSKIGKPGILIQKIPESNCRDIGFSFVFRL